MSQTAPKGFLVRSRQCWNRSCSASAYRAVGKKPTTLPQSSYSGLNCEGRHSTTTLQGERNARLFLCLHCTKKQPMRKLYPHLLKHTQASIKECVERNDKDYLEGWILSLNKEADCKGKGKEELLRIFW